MKRNKFNATKTVVDGIKFDSKKEAKRYTELKLLEKAGEIKNLELQPVFPFVINNKPVVVKSKGFPNGRKASYRADFKYQTYDGEIIIEDVKGFDTYTSRLKRAIIEAIYDIEIKII